MIIYTIRMVVTHDEPYANKYKKLLVGDGWRMTEDTTCATYEKTEYYGEVKDEQDNERIQTQE